MLWAARLDFTEADHPITKATEFPRRCDLVVLQWRAAQQASRPVGAKEEDERVASPPTNLPVQLRDGVKDPVGVLFFFNRIPY